MRSGSGEILDNYLLLNLPLYLLILINLMIIKNQILCVGDNLRM